MLSALAMATVNSTTRNGTTPPQSSPFRVRQVSTNQTDPVFFLFERPRPYGEDNVGKYTSAELIGLLGPNNIPRLLQQLVYSSSNFSRIHGYPAICAWMDRLFQYGVLQIFQTIRNSACLLASFAPMCLGGSFTTTNYDILLARLGKSLHSPTGRNHGAPACRQFRLTFLIWTDVRH